MIMIRRFDPVTSLLGIKKPKTVPTKSDEQIADEERRKSRSSLAKAKGVSSTILQPAGGTSDLETGKKKLLGGS
jgi:hypothetical protein